MKPVEQTRLNAHDGNCHAACIASILEVPLEAVPQPTVMEMADFEGWACYLERVRREFLHPRNLHDMTFGVRDGLGQLVRPLGYSILCAASPRTGGAHAVVALDGAIVFDPHPRREMGLGEWHDWTIFTVLDPTKPVGELEHEV